MPANSDSGPAQGGAPFEQRGRHADVCQTLPRLTVVDWSARLCPTFQADVPRERSKNLSMSGWPVPPNRFFGSNTHDVDVRARMQLAAPVAAHRHERQIVREFARMTDPCGAQRDGRRSRARFPPPGLQTASSATKRSFSSFRGRVPAPGEKMMGGELSTPAGPRVRPSGRPNRQGGSRKVLRAFKRPAAAAGKARRPALSVSTSKPTVRHEDCVLPLSRQRLVFW